MRLTDETRDSIARAARIINLFNEIAVGFFAIAVMAIIWTSPIEQLPAGAHAALISVVGVAAMVVVLLVTRWVRFGLLASRGENA